MTIIITSTVKENTRKLKDKNIFVKGSKAHHYIKVIIKKYLIAVSTFLHLLYGSNSPWLFIQHFTTK